MNGIQTTIEIAERFCGPSNSGNGGYVCGLVASAFPGEVVEVTLQAPPPLGKPLTLARHGKDARLRDGERELATARVKPLTLAAPPAPHFIDAEKAAKLYAGFRSHIAPGCFVCGPDRTAGDGLRIFAGPLDNKPEAAAPWIPDASLAGEDGAIAPEFVWAALDCPGYFGLLQPRLIALLGRMHAQIFATPRIGERCTVTGWRIGVDGRKHHAGSAVHGEGGRLLGQASAIWIELDRDRFVAATA